MRVLSTCRGPEREKKENTKVVEGESPYVVCLLQPALLGGVNIGARRSRDSKSSRPTNPRFPIPFGVPLGGRTLLDVALIATSDFDTSFPATCSARCRLMAPVVGRHIVARKPRWLPVKAGPHNSLINEVGFSPTRGSFLSNQIVERYCCRVSLAQNTT